MRLTPGRLLIATAVGHTLVGLLLFREPLAAILHDGVVNSIHRPQFDRAAAFWFLLFSPILVAIGQVVEHGIDRGDAPILRIIGWYLLAIGILGAAMMPLSGFWIVLVIAVSVLHAARRAAAVNTTAMPLVH